MSSPHRKRQRLSSPKQSASIETIPISSESESDESDDKPVHIPFIQVEDISDDEKDVKPTIPRTPLTIRTSIESPSSSSAVNSPIKMLTQANLFENIRQACVPFFPQTSAGSVTSNPKIEVSKADSQSNVISTTTMLSPFANENRISTLGSPRYMVQEISSTVVTHKRFLLTGLNNCKHETKERMKIMIKQLGGEYIECPNFVERCTHIVLGKPNTGEKYMGGLMTGKWLLKTEYVEESYAEGYWLEEEAYEWTKDAIERLNPETDQELAKLASSARRCRLRYNAEGPFHGWTASILSNHPRRLECYERLFKAGGGRVINIQDYRKRHNELSFILVDNPDQTHIPLKNPAVPLLRISYIHNVVLEDERPDKDLYKVKREDTQNELPTIPWICTFSNVRKQINLTSKKCDRKVIDYIDGVMCSESWGGILLPLTSNQAPPAYMFRSVINKCLLPRADDEFLQLRQVLSDLYILSWFIPPSHDNRDYYANLMQIKEKPKFKYNADKFLFLFEDAVKRDGMRKYPQTPRYLMFWLELLEKDFYNWERRTNNSKPLVERIHNSWHHVRPVFKTFLKSYLTVMTSEDVKDSLKMAMNSHLIVYFTSNEMKRVAKQEVQYQSGTTLDVIAEAVRNVVSVTLRTRDLRRVHVLIHMLSFSYTLMVLVFNKVLLTLCQTEVPQHYKVLADRPPSWEKFYNFFLHVRYYDVSPPSPTFTTDIYLILLTAMFRSLLAQHSKPPSELNPYEKTMDLQDSLCQQHGDISLSSKLMLRLLLKLVS